MSGGRPFIPDDVEVWMKVIFGLVFVLIIMVNLATH